MGIPMLNQTRIQYIRSLLSLCSRGLPYYIATMTSKNGYFITEMEALLRVCDHNHQIIMRKDERVQSHKK